MTILAATNNPDHFGGEATKTTLVGSFDPNFVTHGVSIPLRTAGQSRFRFNLGDLPAAIHSLWHHFEVYTTVDTNNGNSDGYWMSLYPFSGSGRFLMDMSNGSFFFSNANSLIVSGGFTLLANQRYTFDIHLWANGTDYGCEFYLDGISVATAYRSNTSLTISPILDFQHNDMVGTDGEIIYSQFISAYDESTIGMKLMDRPIDVAGHYDEWGGVVDDLSNPTPAEGIYSDTVGQKQTWTTTNNGLVIPAGYKINSVNQMTSIRSGALGPQKVDNMLRIAGVDYPVGNDIGGTAHRPSIMTAASWVQNPNTTADWVEADLASLEFGVESKA